MTIVNAAELVFLSILIERIIEALIGRPIRELYPEINTWWLIFVAAVAGFLTGWFLGLNVFPDLGNETVARVLTCLVLAGGPSLVHEVVAGIPEQTP